MALRALSSALGTLLGALGALLGILEAFSSVFELSLALLGRFGIDFRSNVRQFYVMFRFFVDIFLNVERS